MSKQRTGDAADAASSLLPLTAAQRGMWFAEKLSADYSVNVAQYLDLRFAPGSLDHELLARCNIEVCKELESPYLRLVSDDGVPRQHVDLSYPNTVDIVDLRADSAPEAAALDWMARDYQQRVDVLTDRLVVSALIRIADDRTLWYGRGHHVVIDGYAALTMIRMTVDRYNAVRAGSDAVERPRATIAELVADDERYQGSSRRQIDREHWLRRTADLPENISLASVSAPAALSAENVVASGTLPDDTTRALLALARDRSTSPAVVLVSAAAILLARMTDESDVVLSLPVTGRASARIKTAGGMLANVLPIRVRIEPGDTFAGVVDQVQLEFFGALRHQRYRTEEIRRDAGFAADSTGFGPIVNVMFFDQPIQLRDTTASYHILSSGVLEDLRINLYQSSAGAPVVIDLHGNPNLYAQREIDRHHHRLLRLIDSLIDDPTADVTQVTLLTEADFAALDRWGTGRRVDYRLGADPHLLDRFDEQVRSQPDRVAVRFAGRSFTYREFDVVRRLVAARLRADGVGPGDRVAILLPRSVMQVAAVYATLTLGASYVPIGHADPAARRNLVLATAAPRLVVDERYLAGLPNDPDDLPAIVPRIARPSGPAGITYVIFTSGSTGRPKGVEVSHAAVANRLAWMQDHYPLSDADTVLYKTPITFDVSVWELLWPLQIGATMVIAEPGGHGDPRYLTELIVAAGVTVLHFVPSMLDAFADGVVAGSDAALGATLRRMFTSGEALPHSLVTRVLTHLPDLDVVNLYGPTEAAVDITEHRVAAGDQPVPIGRPVPNSSVYVLDSRLRRVPEGASGELYLAGVQLAVGYAGRAGLSAERFVANTFAAGQRMYRTGDVVRWTRTGSLEYLGRSDFQLKIRGQRVELGEIEAQIASEPTVDTVAVTVREDRGRPELVAYVKPAANYYGRVDADRYIRFCRRRLAAHMAPSVVVLVESFALNSAGKLDRSALPAPTYERVARPEVAAESVVERAVAGVLAELLGSERISMRDNMFALGADSLVAARLVARLHAEHQIELTLTDVFDSEDVGELAALARPADPAVRSDADADDSALAARRPATIPLSPAQSRLWFTHQLAPDAATYHMPAAVWFDDLDLDALRSALADVVERHEVLRTRYPATGGEPRQEVLSTDDVVPGLLVTVEAAADDLDGVVRRWAATGFDLTAAPPVRVVVVRAGPGSPHLVLIVLHHIAADGASLPILHRELQDAYSARRAGRALNLPALHAHYADLTLAAHRQLGDPADPTSVHARQTQFWVDELSGAAQTSALPEDYPRPAIASGAGGYVDIELDAEVLRSMRELAATAGVTLFTVLHAALATLLHRLSGDGDVSIGTAVAGREQAGAESLVGMFVNTVVLRTFVDPGVRVVDLLADAQHVRARAMSHARIPFERVVDAVAPERSRSRSPLFAVMLSLQTEVVDDDIARDGLRTLDVRVPAAKYDLTVSAAIRRAGAADGSETDFLAVELSYATDLFAESTVRRFAEWLRVILGAMAADPGAPLGMIDIVTPGDAPAWRHPTARSHPATLRAILRRGAAAARPHAAGLTAERSFTHAMLAAHVNQLARELISRGIGAGQVVATLAARSSTSVIATLAVAQTGAAFVTVDPAHPTDRRAELIADSGAVLVLTLAEHADAAATVPQLVLDDPTTELRLVGHRSTPVDDAELVAPVYLDDLAYLIYTSGSTGRPKAVAVTHRGLANFTDDLIRKFGPTAESNVLHVASPSFDASILELVMAFAVGGHLVVAPADVYGGRELTALMVQRQVTHVLLTPSALATIDRDALDSLRVVLSAGEACPADLIRRWGSAPGVDFYNVYGPTEVTVWSTTDGPLDADDPVLIGSPIDGVTAVILDAALRPTPDGVPGELYLASSQVARGYLGRPGLTAGRFIANPFAYGSRLYRTGDRVTRRADGRLIYHGRTDFQLKIRGLRIEPGEIDAALARHHQVANAVTLGVPGRGTELALASYVTLVDSASITDEQLKTYAAGVLPAYLVPDAVVIIDEFPVTRIGKIDRDRLPAVDFATTGEFVSPRTELESVIADVMAQILGVTRVSVADSFFELGGNSLSATRLAARVSDIAESEIPVREVFDHPTASELAEFVAGALNGTVAAPVIAREHAEIVPLSTVQRGMWLANQVDPESSAYNVALAVQLTGDLDEAALVAAIDDVVVRHESLRTRYPYVDGTAVQVITPATASASIVDVVDVVGPLDQAIASVTHRGFDLVADPPVRAAVLRDGPGRAVVVIVVHHISADGASLAPLARDLMIAYQARVRGDAPAWRPLPVQYADFAEWQRDRLAALDADGRPERERQLGYWRDRLAGSPPLLNLHADHERPAVPSYRGARVTVSVPAGTVAALDALAHTAGTTLFMVTHAAFAVLLRKLSGQRDIVVGTPYAGRGRSELDDIVGMFVTTLPLRTRVDDSETFTDLLARVRRGDLNDMAHSDVAFDDIVSAVLDVPPASYNPIFQSLFVFQNFTFPTLELPGLVAEVVSEQLVSAKVDLQLALFGPQSAADGGMRAEFDYATDLFDEDTISVAAQRFLALLDAVVAGPDAPIGDIAVGDADSGSASDPSTPLAAVVAHVAARTPAAIAVSYGGVDLSFDELAFMTSTMASNAGVDEDAGLTMALMASLPELTSAGPAELGAVLNLLRRNVSGPVVDTVDTVDTARRSDGRTAAP